MSQNATILAALERGRCLSALDAWRMGIGRLAARVADLRGRGHRIETRMVKVRTRHGHAHVAVYRLVRT